MARPLSSRRRAGLLAAGVALLAAAAPLQAQAWFYPSFQPPRVTDRDYNFAVVANNGTTALFQWREGISPESQLSLDAGLADPDGPSDAVLFVGGNYARQLTTQSSAQPLALLFTVGAGIGFGGDVDAFFRVPVGVSVGHRFDLENGMSITPYAHPRLSLDVCTGCNTDDDTELAIDFDIGASFQLTRQIALRGSLLFSGSNFADDTGIGIGLTWTPAGVRRR
jgi:hypothetical protein